MAKKIQVRLIMQLRDTGMAQTTIASERHMSKSFVNDVFRIAEGHDSLDNPWYMTDERGIPLSYAEAVVTMFELAEEHRCANLNTDSTRI